MESGQGSGWIRVQVACWLDSPSQSPPSSLCCRESSGRWPDRPEPVLTGTQATAQRPGRGGKFSGEAWRTVCPLERIAALVTGRRDLLGARVERKRVPLKGTRHKGHMREEPRVPDGPQERAAGLSPRELGSYGAAAPPSFPRTSGVPLPLPAPPAPAFVSALWTPGLDRAVTSPRAGDSARLLAPGSGTAALLRSLPFLQRLPCFPGSRARPASWAAAMGWGYPACEVGHLCLGASSPVCPGTPADKGAGHDTGDTEFHLSIREAPGEALGPVSPPTWADATGRLSRRPRPTRCSSLSLSRH